MLNQLNSIIEYFKDHLALVIVLGVIVLLIIGLVIAMIVIAAKAKKNPATEPAEAAQEPATTEEPKEEEPAVAEPVKEEPPVAEESAKEEAVQEEPAPDASEKPAKKEPAKKEPKKAAEKEPAAKKEPAKNPAAGGKWIIRKVDGKFAFDLVASNGEVMITSSVPYASLAGAKSGIQTYKSNIASGNFTVTQTKTGDYIFQLLNARGALLASGNDYSSKSNCENAIESTKRWALSDVIEVYG